MEHSEKRGCEREECPRSAGEDVEGLSLLGFKEVFQEGRQLN